jgi:hypothetical protein
MPELCSDRINSGEVGVTAFACPIRATRSRPHQALANRTPMAVWRGGVLGAEAVDMTLRLDNAGALPTYPQPQQPQTFVA